MNQHQEKFIGVVKWFHDQFRNANYGFIQHPKLGDLFFHEKAIVKGQPITDFVEGQFVTFSLNITNKETRIKGRSFKELPELIKHSDAKKNPEAINVFLLAQEDDLEFLFSEYLVNVLEEPFKKNIQPEIEKRILELLNKIAEDKRKLELLIHYRNFIKKITNSHTIFDFATVKRILISTKKFFSESYSEIAATIEENANEEIRYKLWLESYLENCPVSYIANFLFKIDEPTRTQIFKRCTSQDKINIFFRFIYVLEQVDTDFKLDTVKDFLRLGKQFAKDEYDKILNATLNVCPDYYKLSLWLEDFHEILDFDIYKLYTIALPTSDQKKFVKKVLKYIHEEKVNINVEEFASINTINYETSKIALQLDNSKLDYSTSIVLNAITELNNQVKIETRKEENEAKNRMYELIIKQIKKPDDILEIKGFFDECEGRCSASVEEIKNEEGVVVNRIVTKYRDENKKARLHPICDGKKVIDRQTSQPAISEKGIEFWWCANQKCYEPSRRLHAAEEWEKYTLADFLHILKVPYREKDLEIYLSLINKANHFLKHLKCKECEQILRPLRQANYSFHGVSEFHCTNETCSEKDKRIYLSHCLNGYCENVIDSRDSVKCRPAGYEQEKCGWYVCTYCLSCCSKEGIDRRIYIRDKTGQNYDCHTQGHRDLGIISCDKCGSPMESNIHNEEEYQVVLNWFIENKHNRKYVVANGKTRNDKWWFMFKKGEMGKEKFNERLLHLRKLGFSIPNFHDLERDAQLISEPNNPRYTRTDFLTCSNKDCNNVIDLSSDLERGYALRRYHNTRFPRTERNFEA